LWMTSCFRKIGSVARVTRIPKWQELNSLSYCIDPSCKIK